EIQTNAVEGARAREGIDDVEMPQRVERESLRPPKAAATRRHVSVQADPIDDVVGTQRRGGDVQVRVGTECQVECGDARRQRGEQPRIAPVSPNTEDRSRSIADEE